MLDIDFENYSKELEALLSGRVLINEHKNPPRLNSMYGNGRAFDFALKTLTYELEIFDAADLNDLKGYESKLNDGDCKER